MIDVTTLKIDDKNCLGVRIDLPNSPPLLLIIAEKGFVMCGFLNIDAAEKLGVVAAMVSGVKTFDDVISASIKAVTSRAKSLSVELGMQGGEALRRML